MLENPFKTLGDAAIHQSLLGLARDERERGVDIILHLLIVKERKLYAAWGHDSIFTYCTERLGFSRSTAYRRKVVMDKVGDVPSLLDRLKDGRLQLCAAAAVAPHLTAEDAEVLLDAVTGLSHREVEAFLVKRRPPELRVSEVPVAGLALSFMPPILPSQTLQSPILLPAHLPARPSAHSPELSPVETSRNEVPGVASARRLSEPAIPALPLPRTIIKPLTQHASRVNVTLTEPTLALLVRAKELLAGKTDDEIHRLALDALLERLAPERRHARRLKRQEILATKRSGTKVLRPSASASGLSEGLCLSTSALASGHPEGLRPGTSAPASNHSEGLRLSTPASVSGHSEGLRPTQRVPTPAVSFSRRGKLADRDASTVAGGGRCTFIGPDGHRCTARAFIETDHIIPVSKGGLSQRWNFAPLCRTHNAFKGAKLPAHPPTSTLPTWT